MEIISIKATVFHEMLKQLASLIKQVEAIEKAKSGVEITEWLDGHDVCQILKISKRTLQYYRTKRILPYSKIEGKTFYKPADVQKIMNIHFHPKTN